VRTTLSLDEDIAALLNKEMRRSGSSFKETVNHFLRLGLMSSGNQKLKPFKVKPFLLGLPANLNYQNVAELLDELEGPTRR
jgi:hypothetical protein